MLENKASARLQDEGLGHGAPLRSTRVVRASSKARWLHDGDGDAA